MANKSEISKFYAFKKILITGGTGFMGKVLIWKLLYSCPELDTIYAMIRSKHGKSAMSRKKEFFQSPIYNELKKTSPKILEKVILVTGDVGEDSMGLSDEDRNMLIDQVSVIFHGAAILKMDADLRTAVNVNTIGTMRILDIAQQMKKLQAFVHLSTSFCCYEDSIVEERMYSIKHDPYDIINLTSWLEPQILKKITPKLIYPSPNTYIYTKRLTESLLQNYVSKVPIIVARPSVVLPCFKEPIPGWTDSMNGPVGYFVAGAKGILRTTRINLSAKTDAIPVDFAINSILVLPWANSREHLLKQISVYNITQNFHHELTWRDVLLHLLKGFEKYPPEVILWYRAGEEGATNNIFIYTFKYIFLQYLPAYVIDFVLWLSGKKPFLVHIQHKLRHADKVLVHFSQRPWSFEHNKMLELEKLMNDDDKQIFPVNLARMECLQDYMDNCTISTKLYIFKEDMKNIDKAKRTAKIMYVVDKITQLLKYFILWKFFMFIYNIFCRYL